MSRLFVIALSAPLVCIIALSSRPAVAAVFSTIAGSGRAGVEDGPAAQASFLMPFGIAVGSDGTIYVSDYLGQRIRAIPKRGDVRTIAGGGDLMPGGLKVRGDYVDGAAAAARFNGPAGIAVDSRGRIFVADSKNRCIRVIESGHVRTYAGAPNRQALDGPLATAGFWEPRALAIDPDGTMWIGDGPAGLRKITKDGLVGSIPLPSTRLEHAPAQFSSHITSIAIDGSKLMLADGTSLMLYDPQHPDDFLYTEPDRIGDQLPKQDAEWPGRFPTGYPFGVAVLSHDIFVYTDPALHAIRFRSFALDTALGHRPMENDDFFGGGFADSAAGMVNAPLGIASLGPDKVVFADSGSRRVRAVGDIEARHFVTDEKLADPFGKFRDARRYYRILFIGNSFGAYKMPFAQTAAGLIESALNANRNQLELKRPAKLAIIWSLTIDGVRDYIKNVGTTGVADAVIWEFNQVTPNEMVQADPSSSPMISRARWTGPLSADISQIRAALRAAGIPLFVSAQPAAYDFPPIEETWLRATYVGTPDEDTYAGTEQAFAELFKADGSRFIDLWPIFLAAEKQSIRHPLFSSRDYHLTSFGQALVARAIYRRLAADRPWR